MLPPRAHRGTPAQQLLNLDESFNEDILPELPEESHIAPPAAAHAPTSKPTKATKSSSSQPAGAKVASPVIASTSKSSVLKRKAVQRDKAHAEGTAVGEEDFIDVFSIMRDTEAKYDRTATEMYLGLSNTSGASSSFALSSSVTLHAHVHREKHRKYVIQNTKKPPQAQAQAQNKSQSKIKEKMKMKSSIKDVINVDTSSSYKSDDNDDSNDSDSDASDDSNNDEDDDDDAQVLEASAFHVIVVAHTEAASPQTDLLDEVRPGFIVLYDADMGVVRSIEVFNAQHSSRAQPLKVYLLMYGKFIFVSLLR